MRSFVGSPIHASTFSFRRRRSLAVAKFFYVRGRSSEATANRCHSSGTPRRMRVPRSTNRMPEPMTSSLTVDDTITSPDRPRPICELRHDGDASDVVISDLALSRVDSCSDLDADCGRVGRDLPRGVDRSCGSVERCDETSANPSGRTRNHVRGCDRADPLRGRRTDSRRPTACSPRPASSFPRPRGAFRQRRDCRRAAPVFAHRE